MTSLYLQSGDYATFGLPSTTTAAQVTQASLMVDMHLKRPEGLIWTPDAIGNPCYMAATVPTFTFTAPGAISPGGNVTVSITGPIGSLQIGDVLILDAANPSVVEAVVVNAIKPGVSIGLKLVVNPHAPGALLGSGQVINEQRFLPDNRPQTVLSRPQVARIISGTGRYGYSRRSDGGASNINDFNLLAALSQFGGPPVWEIFDALTTDCDSATGMLWIPAGIMLAYYTEVKVRYVAGFSTLNLPAEVKMATAQLVSALADAPDLGAVKSYRAGGTAITRFADTMISGDIANMLEPYRTRAFV